MEEYVNKNEQNTDVKADKTHDFFLSYRRVDNEDGFVTKLFNKLESRLLCVLYISAFEDCKNLSIVLLPSSIEHIESCAFGRCEKLKDIYYLGTISRWNTIRFDDTEGFKWFEWDNCVIHCVDGDIRHTPIAANT